VEIPANWYLDDLPPMMFVKASPNSHGFVNPRDIEQMWTDQFDWVYREQDCAAFTMTIQPDVSGRPQVLMALERIIAHIKRHDGVRWVTFDEIAQDFLRRSPRPGLTRCAAPAAPAAAPPRGRTCWPGPAPHSGPPPGPRPPAGC
jgi:peptidoglycan-N-acetylglucosamine deacetylase